MFWWYILTNGVKRVLCSKWLPRMPLTQVLLILIYIKQPVHQCHLYYWELLKREPNLYSYAAVQVFNKINASERYSVFPVMALVKEKVEFWEEVKNNLWALSLYYASVEEHHIKQLPWKAWHFKCLNILNMACNIIKIGTDFFRHVFV